MYFLIQMVCGELGFEWFTNLLIFIQTLPQKVIHNLCHIDPHPHKAIHALTQHQHTVIPALKQHPHQNDTNTQHPHKVISTLHNIHTQ